MPKTVADGLWEMLVRYYTGQGPVDDLMVREVGIRICLAGVGEPLASWSSRSRALPGRCRTAGCGRW